MQACLRKTQEELEESLKKLSVSEGAAEVNKRYQLELEEERAQFIKNLDTFKQKVQASSKASSCNRMFPFPKVTEINSKFCFLVDKPKPHASISVVPTCMNGGDTSVNKEPHILTYY